MPTIAIGSSLAWARTATCLAAPLAVASAQQVLGERRGARVVEDDGRRQAQPGDRAEPVAQLDRGQRVEAEVLEGPARARPRSAEAWPRTAATSLADQLEDEALALGLGQGGEPGGQRARGGAAAPGTRGPGR